MGRMETLTSDHSGGDAEPVRVRRVIVVAGPNEGAIAVLDESSVEIGRAGTASGPLALDDGEVSRSHATIVYDGSSDSWSVKDRGSHNGTFVGGRRAITARANSAITPEYGLSSACPGPYTLK